MNRIRSLSLGVLLLRIVFAIAAAFFAWLSAPAAVATPSAESCHAHTFNTPIHDRSTYYTQLERGPPALLDQFRVSAGLEAVDHGSHGILARQEVSATAATYDYEFWDLCGSSIVAVVARAPLMPNDPAFELSDGRWLEVFSDHPVDPWSMQLPGRTLVGSPSDPSEARLALHAASL